MEKTKGVLFRRQDYGSLPRRFLAIGVDVVVLSVVAMIMAAIWSLWSETVPLVDVIGLGWIFIAFTTPLYFGACTILFYVYLALIKPSRLRTVGYRIAGLKVLNLHGEKPSVFRMTVRFLLLVFGPFNFIIDLFWIGNDDYRQSIRDKFASTIVVRNNAKPEGTGKIVHAQYGLMGYFLIFREVKRAG